PDIGGDDGAGTDHRVLADRDAAQDRRVGTDRGPLAHEGARELVLALDVGTRVLDVGEHAGRTEEHVVLERDAVVDRHVVLDATAVTDPDLADEAALA